MQNSAWTIAFVLVFFSVRAWQQHTLPKGTAPAIESSATISGKPVGLSQYRGKPVLLYFWATWCRICQFEQPSIRSISRDHQVLSIALQSGGVDQVQEYMRKNNLRMPTVVDEFGYIATQYGVKGTPTAFFINADGKISSIEVGYTSEFGMRLRLWLAGI